MSSEFKKLQAKWYKKLKASGFEDIEEQDSPQEMLKQWHSLYFLSRYEVSEFQAKQRYFELASQFLHTHVFETSYEKAIWRDYSKGLSARAIARHLEVRSEKINRVIKRLERIMLGQPNKTKK